MSMYLWWLVSASGRLYLVEEQSLAKILLEIHIIFAAFHPSTFDIPLYNFTKDRSYLPVPQSKFLLPLSIDFAPTTHTDPLGKEGCQCWLHCLVMDWKLKHLPFGVTLYLHSLLRYIFSFMHGRNEVRWREHFMHQRILVSK